MKAEFITVKLEKKQTQNFQNTGHSL